MPPTPDTRAERLTEAVVGAGLDALIVGDLVRPGDSSREAMADLTWLAGFGGTSGLALIGPDRRLFVTDFRYLQRAEAEVPVAFERIRAEKHLVGALAPYLSGRVGFDPTATSVRERRRLEEAAEGELELVEAERLVERLRRVKDEAEIEAVAAASQLTDTIYAELEQAGLAGRTEIEVGLWIEGRMRELGAAAVAFPPIVAAGPNGALPHSEPSGRTIGSGELVVVDIGAVLGGYCSDGTRTYATGDPGERAREVHELVLAAQAAGLEAIRADESGKAIDAVAREVIASAGYGDHFGHGLGHGVGISVHEAPRLSPRSEDTLLAGDVVTVEPGVYLPGEFGVRIEDLVAVTEDGLRNLSTRPRELLVVG